MILFAADASSAACSAAVLRDGVIAAESYSNVGLTHSETFMVLCDDVFRRAGVTPQNVDYYAVTSGPGSFTGLRIGMSTIKGLAFAAGKPCVAVPTLYALCFGCRTADRTVVATCDARQKRVFAAAYRLRDGEVTELRPVEALPIAQLPEVFGGEPVLFTGDAAQLCLEALRDKMDCRSMGPSGMYVRASFVAEAALERIGRGEVCTAGELCPDYVQPSQAERNWKARHGG